VNRCRFCHEPVIDPFRRPAGVRRDHFECGLRFAVGGIGHLTDHDFWCGVIGDPDAGLSYRESALQVRAWVDAHVPP
jgi:hypothetical protein